MDEHYSQVQATYELVLGYDMQVPAMDMAAYRTLTADMEALQQAVEMVEARQEDQTEAFGRELAAGLAYYLALVAPAPVLCCPALSFAVLCCHRCMSS